MATKFIKQAQAQLNPVFNQQQQAIQSQIPSIENLYKTLSQGLQTNFDTQLASGVQGISEDASARGVLRSTLPVDARQALTTQLGSALQQGLGELGARRAGDIAGIRSSIADLGVRRASSIADLARGLETQDLERQQFAFQKQQAEREFQLAQQKLNSGSGLSAGEFTRQATAQIGQALSGATGRDGYVSPQSYKAARQDWISQGLSSAQFDEIFSAYRNPYAEDSANGLRRSLADYGVASSGAQ